MTAPAPILRGEAVEARRRRVMAFCVAGLSSEEIAAEIGCTVNKVRDDRGALRVSGADYLPSWETLHARGWDAGMARKLRGAGAGEAKAWAKANGKVWPKAVRKPSKPAADVTRPFPKPSYAGLSGWALSDARECNARMRARAAV